MASKILGRTTCPIGCGHDAAHVKLKTDKATEAFPYIHCRGCGCQLHTKNTEQAGHLLAITRPEKIDAPAEPAPVEAALEVPALSQAQIAASVAAMQQAQAPGNLNAAGGLSRAWRRT